MNISALESYVEELNRWGAVFGSKPMNLLNPRDRQRIADHIDSALSPENLHCDGEISASQARAKYRRLTRVAQELQSIDPAVKFYEFG